MRRWPGNPFFDRKKGLPGHLLQCELRLGIHLILSSDFENFAAFFAVVCSTWVPVNRGTGMRSILTPLGNEDFLSIRKSNKMTSRRLER